MASDVERITEVIAVELARQAGDEVAFQPRIFDGITREGTAETVYLRQAGELVAVLKSHGFGHVPTALYQAADEVETALPINCELLPDGREDPRGGGYVEAHGDIGQMLRARADRAGGTA